MFRRAFISWFFVLNIFIVAQNLTVTPHITELQDTLNSEMIFTATVTNISQFNQDVFVVRTINDIPATWYSALCFDACFPTELDSVATTAAFNSSSFLPGESREIAIHVFPLVTIGTGNLQIQVGSFSENERTTINFIANVNVVSVKDDIPFDFYLANNFPNPFNPSTQIKFGIKKSGQVSLKIFNVLGVEVAELVNEIRQPGNYSVSFNSGSLSSGIYFYKLVTNDFSAVNKMILEK
jgi:hypothetical protein